jgi:hypothetical protein
MVLGLSDILIKFKVIILFVTNKSLGPRLQANMNSTRSGLALKVLHHN